MKHLIESSGKRGLRINNKRKNFKTAKPPIEHEVGTIRDKTHPTNRGSLIKKSKKKKLEERNARQTENSAARLILKKEVAELTKESAITELYDDSNLSIGHKNLIDSPTYVARKAAEIVGGRDYSSSNKTSEATKEVTYITGCGLFNKWDTIVSG